MAASDVTMKSEMKFERPQYDTEKMETSEALEEGELSDDELTPAPLAEQEAIIGDIEAVDDPSKRFSLVGDRNLSVPQSDLEQLYESLGIDKETERHYRFNAINVRNVGKMSTNQVLDYFSGLEPGSVNWLADGSCIVEWDDEIMPARALLYLSVEITNHDVQKKVKGHLEDETDSDDDDYELDLKKSIDAAVLKFTLPGGRWRKGVNCKWSRRIIMRYASQQDKRFASRSKDARSSLRHSRHRKKGRSSNDVEVCKDEHNNPWGDLAQSWGYGEGMERLRATPRNAPDLRSSLEVVRESRFLDYCISHAKEDRRQKSSTSSSSDDDDQSSDEEERRRKLPRMYADKEEERRKITRMENALRSSQVEDLRSRLNSRKKSTPRKSSTRHAIVSNSEDSLDDNSTEWAREKYQDIKKTVTTRHRGSGDDSLEGDSDSALSEFDAAEMLQIEVDNEYYKEPRRHRH